MGPLAAFERRTIIIHGDLKTSSEYDPVVDTCFCGVEAIDKVEEGSANLRQDVAPLNDFGRM